MHTTHCAGSCNGSAEDLLNDIALIDQAIDVRWTQVNAAIDTRFGRPARSQAALTAIQVFCSDSKMALLNAILEQRRSIFNRMLP